MYINLSEITLDEAFQIRDSLYPGIELESLIRNDLVQINKITEMLKHSSKMAAEFNNQGDYQMGNFYQAKFEAVAEVCAILGLIESD